MLHDIYWDVKPDAILKGQGCKICGIRKRTNTQRKTHNQYIEEVYKINPNIIVKQQYLGAKIPILHECKKHGIKWKVAPSNILKGHGCSKCKSEKIYKKQAKTNKQYIEELKSENPNIIPLEEYVGANIPILHKCLVDNYEWGARPANLLNGCGCPKCSQRFRRTHNDYVKDLFLINPDIVVIGKFIDMKTPILHYCKKHDIEWKTAPSNIIYQSCGCIECGNEKIHEKQSKTHEQYVKELKEINPNIEVVGVYMGANTSILHKCVVDGYKWNATPGNILYGKGCPKCAGNIKRTHKEYVKELSLVNPEIEVLEDYINANTSILHKCKIHNLQWKAYPSWVLKGGGCWKCGIEKSGNSKRKTHEQYVIDLKRINQNIIVVENYINATTPILHRCIIDGYEWRSTPSNILFGTGCPKCNQSKGEKRIQLWLDSQHISYEVQKSFKDCRDIKPLPFDFYLPNYNAMIEYDGEQHYRPIEFFGGEKAFTNRVKHDNIKNEYCKNNDIKLLRIPYFKNIEEELNNFLFI